MSQRGWALAELGAATVLVGAGLWLVRGREGELAVVAIALVMVGIALLSHRRRSRASRAVPPRRIGALRAWGEALAGAIILASLTAGWVALIREPYDELRLAPPSAGPDLAVWLLRRIVYAAAQQLLLQWFLAPVCTELAGGATLGCVLAAGLFGVAHLPSLTLAVLTALSAWVWIALYRRGRRLAPLVATHALLWTVAFAIVPDRLTYDMRVGVQAVQEFPRFRLLDSAFGRTILRAVSSPEYFARQGGTDEAYIRALYRDILGRTPSDEEVSFWLQRRRIESRLEVAKKFVVSDELARIRDQFGDRYSFPFRR